MYPKRILAVWAILGVFAAGIIALGIAGIFLPAASVSKSYVKATVAAAVGPGDAVLAAEQYLAGQAANSELKVVKEAVVSEKTDGPNKEVVTLNATLTDGAGDVQNLKLNVVVTKGVWQGQSIQQAQ